MNAKEAIQRAKSYVADVFSDEGIYNIGLEELAFDASNNIWDVTVGFFRKWDDPPKASILSPPHRYMRTYKTVEISDVDGEVRSVKNRMVSNEAA